ncbi:MAG: M15 family metallopeptidase, partial [Cyanobacteria bacterium J06642_11]
LFPPVLQQHPAAEPDSGELMAQVYQFWAAPSHDPATPPPHSTGAAIDITLVNDQQQVVDMGSAIDEISERSYPNYFADKSGGEGFHRDRTILATAMKSVGFQQHPNEWWHFSLGDQLWAWLESSSEPARYGRAK